MTEEQFQAYNDHVKSIEVMSKQIGFHNDFSVEYVNRLAELKHKTKEEWDEFKGQYSYTAVKHYIIANCCSLFPIGLHCAKDILLNAGMNNSDIEAEIQDSLDYSIGLGYLEKVVLYDESKQPISYYKIIKNWN